MLTQSDNSVPALLPCGGGSGYHHQPAEHLSQYRGINLRRKDRAENRANRSRNGKGQYPSEIESSFFQVDSDRGECGGEEKQKIYALSLKLGHFSCTGEINDEQSSSADSHPGEGGGEECRGDIGKEHGVTSSGGGTALKAPCR